MRSTYAHEAVVRLEPGGDAAAIGAGVTLALCGALDHRPPCPLAPHHTRVEEGADDEVRLRILFATEPDREAEVRRIITSVLTGGRAPQRGGGETRWVLLASRADAVGGSESGLAERLRGGRGGSPDPAGSGAEPGA